MISVVIPVHNEERSVALLLDELGSALDPLDRPWEAVFVDDGSSDGTFGALTRLHVAATNVRIVRLRRNFGKAAALQAGFEEARGDIVVTIERYQLTRGWRLCANDRVHVIRRVRKIKDFGRHKVSR